MKMLQFEYQVRFHTPAFLGNAEQDGQWRTPPFKALLRQWWRVAAAAGRHDAIDIADLRRREGALFGVAADGQTGSRKSALRIRLDCWDRGQWLQKDKTGAAKVTHREIKQPVDPLLYLGYGPLTFSNQSTMLKKNAAIQSGELNTLHLAVPEQYANELKTTLWLLHHYGTVGGRSRNGWGSFGLTPMSADTPRLDEALDARLARDWKAALRLDWPHAIGQDDTGLLIWETPAGADWKTLMRQLAEIKIDLRTKHKQFEFSTGGPHPKPLDRHWLSYPVTRHGVQGWGNLRLPNSLRFKVRQNADGALYGVIFHVPCKPPAAFKADAAAIESVWSRVHRFLDDPVRKLSRISA